MNLPEIKGVGLNPNSHVHLTEHLAHICVIMGIPLLLTNEDFAIEVKRLYPGLETLLVEWDKVNPEYLIQNFDLLIQSEYWGRKDFYSKFSDLEKKYNKTIRDVHCPHGFSDKYRWFEQAVWEDILLVYGDNMLDMFKGMGIDQHLNAYVRTGNYRYSYYLKHKEFYDNLVQEKIWSRFAVKQPTILYAPSWFDQDNNPSMYGASTILLDKLPSHYNFIFKPHPVQEHIDAPNLYKLMGKYEKKSNVVFVNDFQVIYPMLAHSDIYIGDISSVGYDFLSFKRPMFFLNQEKIDSKTDRRTFLYQCGVEVVPEKYGDIYSIIESSLKTDAQQFKAIRDAIYHYTFGDPIPEKELKSAIINSYYSTKKQDL